MTGTDKGTAGRARGTARGHRKGREGPGPDQTIADLDQTYSDADEMAADRDAAGSRADQSASEADQSRADQARDKRQRDPGYQSSAEDEMAYDATFAARHATAVDRLGARVTRTETSRRRLRTAEQRDANSRERDEAADLWDVAQRRAEQRALPGSVAAELQLIRERAAADRRRAAADRERAAQERAAAWAEIARLHAELETAHLDDLTGAYRRAMGELTLQHEIERARRGHGSFVIAFVDVDGMKEINDREGHAAGDHVLRTLVWTMRAKLRPFDPIVRYGGDEFVAGLGGAHLDEAAKRFDVVRESLSDEVGVGVSVGLAELEPDETLEHLTARADALLLAAKAHRAQRSRGGDPS